MIKSLIAVAALVTLTACSSKETMPAADSTMIDTVTVVDSTTVTLDTIVTQ